MAGIIANSASVTIGAGSTSADNTQAGYLNQEQVTCSTTPTGSAYVWSLAKPSGATSKSDLSSTTAASVTFTPDVAGYYVITCVVDSTTTYILRISVTDTVASTAREAIRLQPKTDAQIATPSSGVALYYSSDQGALCIKDAAGDVSTVDLTPV